MPPMLSCVILTVNMTFKDKVYPRITDGGDVFSFSPVQRSEFRDDGDRPGAQAYLSVALCQGFLLEPPRADGASISPSTLRGNPSNKLLTEPPLDTGNPRQGDKDRLLVGKLFVGLSPIYIEAGPIRITEPVPHSTVHSTSRRPTLHAADVR